VDSSSTFLFHRHDFVFRNPESDIIAFENPRAKIYFTHSGNSIVSLGRSPFGSFITDQEATHSDLTAITKQVITWCSDHQIVNVFIRCFPEIYAPNESKVFQQTLLENGFLMRYNDITQVLMVSSKQLTQDVHKKRRVKKANQLGFRFSKIAIDSLEEAYSLFVESRQSKNYPVTMTFKELNEMFVRFPEEYLLFGVFDKSKMIAASVCIKLNKKILYCFYIGDHLPYRSDSPVTFLINGIYDYCLDQGFVILDLGLSTDKGVLNKGLYTYKRTFGSIDSNKITFEKKL
jgi:hypothetical protein